METLLIIIMVVMVGSWLLRRLAPWLLLYFVKQLSKRSGNFYTSENSRPQSRPEGEVNVKDTPQHEKKKITKEVGEYVEFEEI